MDLMTVCAGWAGFVWATEKLWEAPIRPALCQKNAAPLDWSLVSFSIAFSSSLEIDISVSKHFSLNLDMSVWCSQNQKGLAR